jgi:Ca2+-binding RTX toxin-like protein
MASREKEANMAKSKQRSFESNRESLYSDDRQISMNTQSSVPLAVQGESLSKGGNDDSGNQPLIVTDDASMSPGMLQGSPGNDTIRAFMGSDTVKGRGGNDLIISRSDAGEPVIAQASDIRTFNANQPYGPEVTNDILSGGDGSDTFVFRMDLDGRPEIVAKHTVNGIVDWEGVAGENNGVPHDHWVNSIGTDTITDFKLGQDTLQIVGHTAEASFSYADIDGNGKEDTVISVKSNQGGAGSHNGDSLGTINVLNVHLTADNISVNAGVHLGAFGNVDDWALS